MTEQIDRIELTSTPEEHSSVFERAFNSGDLAQVKPLFEDGAIFVPEAGITVSGEEMYQGIAQFQSLGLPLKLTTRHTYVSGDIALFIVDWVIDGTDPDGQHVHMEGTGTDVARRGSDGKWRYVIDNRLGTAKE